MTRDSKILNAECISKVVRSKQQAFRAALIVSMSGQLNCIQEAPTSVQETDSEWY